MPSGRNSSRNAALRSGRLNRSSIGRLLARLLFWGALAGILAVAIVGAILGLNHVLFAANPLFTLRRTVISGNRTVTEAAVQERLLQAGVVVGESNLLSLPMRALREQLEQDPMVAEVRLYRILPNTLNLTLTERIPIAAVQCQKPCFLDKEGIVLPWRDVSRERVLPTITGVRNADRLEDGGAVHDEALRGAVRLLRLLASRPDGVAYDISVIQLDYYLPSLRVYLRPRGIFREGAVVIIPVQEMEAALDRLWEIHRIRSAAGQTTSYVDVTYQRNIPIRP